MENQSENGTGNYSKLFIGWKNRLFKLKKLVFTFTTIVVLETVESQSENGTGN